MSDPLLIREATERDAPAISGLIRSLSRYFLADPEAPEVAAGFFATITPDAIAGYLAGGRFRYHLAEVGGRLAGVVAVRDNSHLYHLFVAEAFHRQGIAKRLWSVAREAALAAGNPGHFTVNSSRYAVPVYQGLGFVATSEPLEKDGVAFVPMELSTGDDRPSDPPGAEPLPRIS